MRISPRFSALVLCVASIGIAHAQQTAINPRNGATHIPTGMSFAYDAQHRQISASGVQLNPFVLKSGSITPTTGTIDVTINIKLVSHFRHDTTFHCSVYAIGGILDLNNGTVDGGIETANGIGRVTSPGVATCTLSIPYSWTLATSSGADSGLILAYAAAAVSEHDDVTRSTLQLNGIENLPASGTTSKFAFDVAL